ncbi:hypothetical protein V8E54_014770 [Elaphomyces granulatus]
MSSPSPAEVVPRMTMKVRSKCRRQLSLSFFAAEGDRQFVTCNNICRADQRRRYQQRRVLGASAFSERSAEDANLLSVPNPPPRRNLTHGVMGERYRLGGRVETDTVAMAAARQEQAGIQRRHRLERRQSDDPSQTPPFTSLVARHEVSQSTEEPPPQLPINPTLPDQPRRGRGRPPIPDDPIDPAQPRRGRGRPPIPDDPIDLAQPRRGRGCPSLPDDPIDPVQPRRGRGRPSLTHDPIDPPQSRRGLGRPSLPDDPIDPAQPRRGRGRPSLPRPSLTHDPTASAWTSSFT